MAAPQPAGAGSPPPAEGSRMPTVTVGRENSADIEIHYEDHAVACIPTWATDFRADLPEIDVPILVVQGDADRVLPLDKTGQRPPALIKDPIGLPFPPALLRSWMPGRLRRQLNPATQSPKYRSRVSGRATANNHSMFVCPPVWISRDQKTAAGGAVPACDANSMARTCARSIGSRCGFIQIARASDRKSTRLKSS